MRKPSERRCNAPRRRSILIVTTALGDPEGSSLNAAEVNYQTLKPGGALKRSQELENRAATKN
jgi:hypothetical protein